jgi:hypothetical protein
MSEETRFDDWTEVKECSNCQRWWNDQCDGTLQGSVRPCKQFLATRNVKIPEELSKLKRAVKGLIWAVTFILVSLLLHYLGVIF